MNTNTTASQQMFKRPADECYKDFDSLVGFLEDREKDTGEFNVFDMHTQPSGDRLTLTARTEAGEGVCNLTDWSFKLLCSKARSPYRFLNQLPPEQASNDINYMFRKHSQELKTKTVVNIHAPSKDELPTARAFYTPSYGRIPDSEFAKTFSNLSHQYGYEPIGTFAGRKWGMESMRPEATGLYSGDRDTMICIANEEKPIPHDNGELYHAIIAHNSEVCAYKYRFEHMLYDFICMNHIIWGVCEHKISERIHKGNAIEVLGDAGNIFAEMEQRRDSDNDTIMAAVRLAQREQFARTREKAGEKLEAYMQKREASSALEFLEHPKAFAKNPLSFWGVASAVTLYSQTMDKYAGNRARLDGIAGRILDKVPGLNTI